MGPRLNRRNAQIIRSQFAIELVLSVLALAAAVIVIRLVFKLLAIPAGVWSGNLVYGVSDRLVWPITVLPGGDRMIWGAATLTDVTAVTIVLMLPFVFTLRGRGPRA